MSMIATSVNSQFQSNCHLLKFGVLAVLLIPAFSPVNAQLVKAPTPVVNSSSIDPIKIALQHLEASMMKVEGGEFQMGCTGDQGSECTKDELPVHMVSISEFRILKTEVTQELWVAIMGTNPSHNQRSNQFPVENVSYADVDAFIQKLNQLSGHSYRLPTEAEWEYAARGGKKSRHTMYSGSADPNSIGWNSANSLNKTHVIALRQANEIGLFDMSGNVWEWCDDWYGTYSGVHQSDPRGPSSGEERVVRGGSYAGSAWFCRNGLRFHYPANYKGNHIGFRLAEGNPQ